MAHELIKIRVFSDARAERDAMLERICGELGAAPVQHLGKLLIVWRAAPKEPAHSAAAPPQHGRGKVRGAEGAAGATAALAAAARAGARPARASQPSDGIRRPARGSRRRGRRREGDGAPAARPHGKSASSRIGAGVRAAPPARAPVAVARRPAQGALRS